MRKRSWALGRPRRRLQDGRPRGHCGTCAPTLSLGIPPFLNVTHVRVRILHWKTNEPPYLDTHTHTRLYGKPSYISHANSFR